MLLCETHVARNRDLRLARWERYLTRPRRAHEETRARVPVSWTSMHPTQQWRLSKPSRHEWVPEAPTRMRLTPAPPTSLEINRRPRTTRAFGSYALPTRKE